LVIALLVFLKSSGNLYGQVEFFGQSSGLSQAYLKGFSADVASVQAYGLDLYFKPVVDVGFALEWIDEQTVPVASFLFLPDVGEKPNRLRLGLGVTYSNIKGHDFLGLSSGFIRCFFPESNYPFSLNASFSVQAEIEESLGYMQTIIGFGYSQAFFAKNQLYPFISISDAFTINEDINLFSFMIGLNFRFSKPSADK